MKKIQIIYISTFLIITSIVGCSIDEVTDPNTLGIDDVLDGNDIGQINALATGVVATMRNGIGTEATASGTMARELYLFDADPSNTGALLGKNGNSLDNNAFYSTTQWAGRYATIKVANLLIQTVTNSALLSEEERQGYLGYAKTLQGYEFIQLLKSYGQARIEVSDPDNLGDFLDFDAAIVQIKTLLNDAQQNLNNAGTSFNFSLPNGFDGFDTPENFLTFNRAILAIAEIYDENGQGALDALSTSFLDLNADLNIGPKHVFGQSNGDAINPVFKIPSLSAERANNADQIIVHNSWIRDAESGDLRIEQKVAERPNPTSQDGLNGTHETRLYANITTPIDIIRNEELILVYAEANIVTSNFNEAATALNVIRNAYGLPDYSGMLNRDELTAEMLKQRRYSLWAENHRMFDLRRYGLSETLPIDREEDQIFSIFPIPLVENLDR